VKPEESEPGSDVRIEGPETTFHALYPESEDFPHEEYNNRRNDKLRDKQMPWPLQQRSRKNDVRVKYIGGFRQVSTPPSTDTNQSAATGMQLDVPSNTQQAPSHVDEELPAVQHAQQYTAEAPQLIGSEMFSKRDRPVHRPQQVRHNTAVWLLL
jgi:hypothetical protein